MEQLPLISVIVPVYKVEAFLDPCIATIAGQTYRNLEIILVDDGSPDGCGAICDAWAAKDPRIRVIHQENGGLAHARNVGMAMATGELIGFVDGDDRISPHMYQLLWQHMEQNHCDISACGVEMIREDGTPLGMLTQTGNAVLEPRDAMEAILRETWLKQPVWNKLYRAEGIRDIPFPVGKCHEDVFWSYQAVGRAKRVAVFDQPCYFYRQRADSIMGQPYSLKRLDGLEAQCLRLRFIRQHFPDLLGDAARELLGFCLWSAQMSLKYLKGPEKEAGLAKLEQVWRETCAAAQVTAGDSLWLGLCRISLKGAARLRNFLGIGL